MFKKILVPIDGTAFSKEATLKAKEIAEKFGSEVVLLHVMETTTEDYPSNPYKFSRELVDKLKFEHKIISDKILESAKSDLECLGDKVTGFQKEGLPYTEIVKFAEEIDADLIVIGSSGTRGFLGILGSVARKVAINSEKSVLIVKEKGSI